MNNLEKMKQSLCEQIQNMDVEQFYDFTCKLEELDDHPAEKSLLSMTNVLTCVRCREVYGNCDELSEEDKCIGRFKNHCAQRNSDIIGN